ncbi:hypothetical protein BpHYR1_046145 [Brachionus plicatilis]|uniref:Uncharacterized protein n=1 Tax=Brachionus plicatilis TaxID=10195 RepID=A0A3M7R2G0_BRAPC|nr:hypothetical protein BpHYR1_046145 [Brachionus plicatilis]
MKDEPNVLELRFWSCVKAVNKNADITLFNIVIQIPQNLELFNLNLNPNFILNCTNNVKELPKEFYEN